MLFRSRSSSNRVLFFVVVFVAMQGYALYASTFHKFHGMPPMCELCAAVKSYQNGLVSAPTIALQTNTFEKILRYLPHQVQLIVIPLYQSRAPPHLSLIS